MTNEPNPAIEAAADDVEALDAEPTPARLELEPAVPVLAMVGEAGPEIVTLPKGSTVLPVDPFLGFYQDNATIVEGVWAGLTNYECSACGFSHLDRERVAAHVSIHGQTFTQGGRP